MPALPDDKAGWMRAAPLVLVAALAIVAKIPTLAVPAFWDETAWLGQAGWLADNGLWRVFPGTRPDAQFFGHPPGLHLAAAASFRVFGHSIVVAHALIALISAAGVVATFVLTRHWQDTQAATLAALSLFLSPAWFSSAGVFLADLPVAALAVIAAVCVQRGHVLAYIATASAMVLVKETAVSVVGALTAWRLLVHRPPRSAIPGEVARYASPLLVFLAFIAVQKAATGRFFYIYDFETDALFSMNVGMALQQAMRITTWLFVSQFRWLFTAAILLDVWRNRQARRRDELWLLLLAAVTSGYAFSVLFYMPRYLLPVLPFFHAAGALAILRLAGTPARRFLAATAVLAVTVVSLLTDRYRGHGEDNMQYVSIVRMHQAAARELVTRYAGARVVAAWPVAAELTDPLLGYVETPLAVRWFNSEQDLELAEVAVVARPANDGAVRLDSLMTAHGWPVVFTRQHGPATITAYRRP